MPSTAIAAYIIPPHAYTWNAQIYLISPDTCREVFCSGAPPKVGPEKNNNAGRKNKKGKLNALLMHASGPSPSQRCRCSCTQHEQQRNQGRAPERTKNKTGLG